MAEKLGFTTIALTDWAKCVQVKDEDIGTDKKLGITSIPLAALKPDEEEEITKNLAVSLDRDRVKDKGDRGSITIKVRTKLCLCFPVGSTQVSVQVLL